jgi:hypothetical protein
MKYFLLSFGLFISLSSFSQVDIVCFGSELENYSIVPNAGSTYSWAVVGGGVIIGSSTGTSINVDWSMAPLGLIVNAVTLTESLSSNCTADATIDVDIVDNPDQTLLVDDSEICIGDEIVLTATSYVNTNYSWTPFVSANNTVNYTPVSTSDNTFSVTATNTDGCSSTSSVTIIVNDLPTLAATISDNEICLGESVDLSATPGLVTYSWNPAVVSNVGGNFTPLLNQTNFNVLATDANGCSSSDDVALIINESPNLSLTVDGLPTTSICIGDQIDLQATPGLNTYVWTPNVILNEGGFYTPLLITETTYSVTATDINGCESTETLNITINNIPNPGPIIFN